MKKKIIVVLILFIVFTLYSCMTTLDEMQVPVLKFTFSEEKINDRTDDLEKYLNIENILENRLWYSSNSGDNAYLISKEYKKDFEDYYLYDYTYPADDSLYNLYKFDKNENGIYIEKFSTNTSNNIELGEHKLFYSFNLQDDAPEIDYGIYNHSSFFGPHYELIRGNFVGIYKVTINENEYEVAKFKVIVSEIYEDETTEEIEYHYYSPNYGLILIYDEEMNNDEAIILQEL